MRIILVCDVTLLRVSVTLGIMLNDNSHWNILTIRWNRYTNTTRRIDLKGFRLGQFNGTSMNMDDGTIIYYSTNKFSETVLLCLLSLGI